MKNSKWKVTGIIVLLILLIVVFHSYYNLMEITTPPSKAWSRDIGLKEITPLKKQPSIVLSDKYADILVANKEHFMDVRVDRQNGTMTKSNINVKGAQLDKLVKQEWTKYFLFWTENYTLFYSPKNNDGTFTEKIQLADSVKDFTSYEAKSGLYLAVTTDSGIKFFKGESAALKPFAEDYMLKNAGGAAMIEDNNGLMHAAVYGSLSEIEYSIHYLTLREGKWQTQADKIEKILTGNWKINSIDIGLDQTDTYIFYTQYKWDRFGVASKTYFTRIPLSTVSTAPEKPQTMEFYRFIMDKGDDADDSASFINEPKLSKKQSTDLNFAIVRNDSNHVVGDGFAVYIVTMDQSQIFKTVKATNTKKWLSTIDFKEAGSNYALTMLDLESGFRYQPFYTETGESFKKVANKGSAQDVLYALLNALPGYINSSLIIMFKAFVLCPALIWVVLVEALELRKLMYNEKLTLGIGFAIYLVMKLYTMGSYYKESTLWLMPPALTFYNAPDFYGITIAVISFLVSMLARKTRPDMHYIMQFLIFFALDIVLTAFLYAQYIL